MSTRTLITGGTVLVGPPLTGHFATADVLIIDGRIAEIGTDLDPAGSAHSEVIDATGTFVLPGFVDAHAHLWEASMRGISADWNIIDFAWSIRFHHAGLHLPEDLYAGAYAGALSSLDSGTTTVLDHVHAVSSPAHADESLRAVNDAGIRAVWAYGLNDIQRLVGADRGRVRSRRRTRRAAHRARQHHLGVAAPTRDRVLVP